MGSIAMNSALTLSMSPRGILVALGTVLTVLPNGDVVVESIGSTWVMTAERLPGGEISVTGGSGAAVFRYSTDGGVTWTEGTSPGIINELGEVIIEALGDAVESDPVPLFFEDTFAYASGTLAGRVSPTGGTWSQHPGSTLSHSTASASSSIWQDVGTGLMTNNQATPSADYFVEADMKVLTVISGNSVACCGRFDSAALTYYAIRYTGTAFILFKSIAGTLTTLATYTATQATGVTAVIRLEVNGDQISGYVDGVLRMGPVTDTSITAAGRVGTRMFTNLGTSGTTGQHFEAMRAGAL